MLAWKHLATGAIRQRFVARTADELRRITAEHDGHAQGCEPVHVVLAEDRETLIEPPSEDAQP